MVSQGHKKAKNKKDFFFFVIFVNSHYTLYFPCNMNVRYILETHGCSSLFSLGARSTVWDDQKEVAINHTGESLGEGREKVVGVEVASK